jgi:radical SAM protein with 4Fe4S-binding SPASM domain
MTLKENTKNILKNILGPQNVGKVNGFYRNVLGIRKYSLLIDVTNSCNLRCKFCSRDNSKIIRMTASEFDKILAKTHKKINSLQLSCAWEYSVSKNATEIVKVLGKYYIPNTSIYSNGNILPDDLAKAIIESRLKYFVISIGEVKKETYEKIRTGGTFEKVLNNIMKLNAMKKQDNSTYPHLCANLTLINSNIGELLDFVDLAHDLGIEEIRGRHLILNKGCDNEDEIIKNKKYANSVIESASKKATVLGMSFSIPKYIEQNNSKSCRAPWNQLYISSEGNVAVCPRIHLYARIGNLIEEDLRDIIKSNEMRDLKDQFIKGKFKNPVCGICMANRESEIAIDQGF